MAPLHSGLAGNWSGPTGKDHIRTPRSQLTRLAPLAAEFFPGGRGAGLEARGARMASWNDRSGWVKWRPAESAEIGRFWGYR